MSLALTWTASASRSLDTLRRTLVLIGMGYLIVDLADPTGGIGKLPLQFLLKDRLHFSAPVMAGFLAISGFAWYFKPLAGVLTDSIPLFGTRRRHYLLLNATLAGALWLLLSGALSDVIGSRLFDQYHWSFTNLVWLNAGTTALVLLSLPLLPQALIRQRDGESAAP